jgi:hypothetical protein
MATKEARAARVIGPRNEFDTATRSEVERNRDNPDGRNLPLRSAALGYRLLLRTGRSDVS